MYPPVCSFGGILIRYHGEEFQLFAMLTDALEAGDAGAMLVLLAIGIKRPSQVCTLGSRMDIPRLPIPVSLVVCFYN